MAAKFLGQFLLEQGLIDRRQLLDALDAQRNSNPLLGELAQAAGMLDAEQAGRINQRQRCEDKRFGDIARDMGLLSAAQVDMLLAQQHAGRRLFGDILVEQGALSRQQLIDALQAQRHDRDHAIEALALGVADHASGDVLSCAIDTCTRLFPRLLGTHCQFSSLANSAEDVAGCPMTAQVRVEGQRPLRVGVACEHAVMVNIAAAFLSLPPGDCDDSLARDALGELVNVLMGYIVKDVLPEGAQYRALPPQYDTPADELLTSDTNTLAVTMSSQFGPFVLLVAG